MNRVCPSLQDAVCEIRRAAAGVEALVPVATVLRGSTSAMVGVVEKRACKGTPCRPLAKVFFHVDRFFGIVSYDQVSVVAQLGVMREERP